MNVRSLRTDPEGSRRQNESRDHKGREVTNAGLSALENTIPGHDMRSPHSFFGISSIRQEMHRDLAGPIEIIDVVRGIGNVICAIHQLGFDGPVALSCAYEFTGEIKVLLFASIDTPLFGLFCIPAFEPRVFQYRSQSGSR